MNSASKCLDIKNFASLALCLLALALPGIAHAVEAGKFQFVNGDIKVISASGTERKPVKGEVFNAGETIITGAGGSAQIRMTDGGFVAIRPDTQMKLDQYVFNGREDGSERKLVSLIKGGFRAITGLIGNRNKENYRIITPSATIGIRGTDHEAVVIPPGSTGGFAVGTYDRVYRGATIIETDKGKLIVNPNQVGFTPGKGVAPVLLPKIPEFYDTRPPKPDVGKDPQKDSKESDSDSRKTDAKSTSVRSRPALRETDSKDATSLRNPLDANVKDLGTSTLKTDALTPISPLTDTTIRSTTTTSTLTDTSTTTLKSTETLIAPISTTPITTITPITTTISPITTTAPITTTTTIAPLTTTIQKTDPILTAPLTTTITR